MTPSGPAPFADLTPECVLDAVDSLDLVCDGHLLALNSYENRVYQVGLEETDPVIAKFYRPGRWSDAAIGEEQTFLFELADLEIPVVAPLRIAGRTLFTHGDYRFSLSPRRGGRPPELDAPGVREWLGRFIGRIHAAGASRMFTQRPTLDLASFGSEPSEWLRDGDWIPSELRATHHSVIEQALTAIAACYQRAGAIRMIRLHGDCHLGNLFWTAAGPHFVDFDDARMGPAIQDLWMLLSGNREDMQSQLAEVLAGYEDFYPFDYRELHLIEALRALRIIHHAAWLARRWHDPAFPRAFPWFAEPRFWQEHILQLREQIAAMEEGPLWSG